jgi:uncharacterized membrane protein YoaK (UPF0700 family)
MRNDVAAPIAGSTVLAAVLSMTAGAVDVIGFLGLGGLFMAHITGNIVVLVVHYTTGRFGRVGPVISVPVFIVVLAAVTWAAKDKPKHWTLRALLVLQAALLAAFFVLVAVLGPFTDPNTAVAVSVSMLGVAAMAVQNALVQLDLPGFPTTAALTTDTVRLAIDLASVVRGDAAPEETARAWHRVRMTSTAIAGFIVGCAAGGLLEVHFKLGALAFPAALALITVPLGRTLHMNGVSAVRNVVASRTNAS